MSATTIKAGQLAATSSAISIPPPSSVPPPSFPLHPFRIPLPPSLFLPSILSHAPFLDRSLLLRSTLDLGLVYFLPSFLSILSLP
ncbi:hypothetical protein B0H14DRAFT_3457559 [Mycena olivaceomarginata]|nr:hypothetical protein B0H14DRAFT_3457559 [Mycena olivaceomarginata]